jgi:hypothetical protein
MLLCYFAEFFRRFKGFFFPHIQVIIFTSTKSNRGSSGGAVGWGTAIQAVRLRIRFPMVSLEFFIDIILPAAQWPWGNTASNRNKYQEYFMGGKGGRCVGLTTLLLSCVDYLEIWEPQTHGTLWACPGL